MAPAKKDGLVHGVATLVGNVLTVLVTKDMDLKAINAAIYFAVHF